MVALAKSIVDDIFLDESDLNIQYISWALNLFDKKHTQERLVQTLNCLVACKVLSFDVQTNSYKRAV